MIFESLIFKSHLTPFKPVGYIPRDIKRDRTYLTSPFRVIDCVADGSYETNIHDTMHKFAYTSPVASLFFIFCRKNYPYTYRKLKKFMFNGIYRFSAITCMQKNSDK